LGVLVQLRIAVSFSWGVLWGTSESCEAWHRQWLAESTAHLCGVGDPGELRLSAPHPERRPCCVLARPIFWLRLLAPTPAWLSTLETFDTAIRTTVLQLMGFDARTQARPLHPRRATLPPCPWPGSRQPCPSPWGA